jgi:hypothetical protein
MGTLAFPILRSVQHGCDGYKLLYPIDLVNHDVG